MNAIWGAGMLSLTKLIVVVDADCDVHDYSRGRLAGVRQRRLRPRPAAHRSARSTTSTTRRYQQFWGGKAGVDATAKLPTEGYTRGWPEMISQDPGDRRAGRPPLEGVRHL